MKVFPSFMSCLKRCKCAMGHITQYIFYIFLVLDHYNLCKTRFVPSVVSLYFIFCIEPEKLISLVNALM